MEWAQGPRGVPSPGLLHMHRITLAQSPHLPEPLLTEKAGPDSPPRDAVRHPTERHSGKHPRPL